MSGSLARTLDDGSTAICVLGPSRTGTSLTTRILALSGVDLGREEDLLQKDLHQLAGTGEQSRAKAAVANPEGFWEHYAIMRTNERLLRAMGGSWRDPPPLPADWERSPDLDAERERARALLAESFAGRRLWGWKDPRNSLTLPFWRALAPNLRCVICLRNPLDVAASLDRRDGIAAEHSFELWLAYVASALVNTRGLARLLVSYEDYFEEPEAVAERLSRFAGDGSDPEIAKRQARAAVNERLRHHDSGIERALEGSGMPADVSALYLIARLLERSTRDGDRAPAGAPLERAVELHAERLLTRRGCR